MRFVPRSKDFFFETEQGFWVLRGLARTRGSERERFDSIGLFSLDTLCLGLFLDAIRRGALAWWFFGVSWEEREKERRRERESYLVWLGLFVGLRGMVILLVENWNFK